MKVKEIAERINAHLKRFADDPEINRRREHDKVLNEWVTLPIGSKRGHALFYHAGAWVHGRFIAVVYITYQGSTSLSRERAEKYLAWLDAGNIGRHYEAESAMKEQA